MADKDFGVGVRIMMDGNNRNKPCPCGSGVKFKKCHGKNYAGVILGDVPQKQVNRIVDAGAQVVSPGSNDSKAADETKVQ